MLQRVARAADFLAEKVTAEEPIYGVNTGFGKLAKTRISDDELATLQLYGVEIVRVPLMNKDSLDMTSADHDLIARTAHADMG